MNTCVQAEALTINLVARMIDAKVSTVISLQNELVTSVVTTCLYTSSLSVNGHSISAINPENILIGGETTLAMA
jgi:hypothetical protein